MRKKRATKIPEQSLGPIKMKRDTLVAAMRRLVVYPEWQLLRSLWLGLRGDILEGGKNKPAEGQWYVLAGFDRAIMEPDRWASMETLEDKHNAQAEELRKQLAGTEER